MKYFMSVDGGGTKILSLIFNEDLKSLCIGSGGAINANFESLQMVRSNMEMSIDQCLKAQDISTLEHVYICMPGPADLFMELLRKRVQVQEYEVVDEGHMCLYAGLLTERGIVALSGSGSGVFNISGPKCSNIGGWGGLIGDEGSGYYVGRAGILGAIKAFDTRGEKTLITDLLFEKFKLMKLFDLVNIIYSTRNFRGVISSVCALVAEAATAGDHVSLEIMKDAGLQMAQQAIAIKRRDGIVEDKPVLISGSVWKGSSMMFDTFCEILKKQFPDTPVLRPLFEPVMGGVIKYAIQNGGIDAKRREYLKSEFAKLMYDKQKEE